MDCVNADTLDVSKISVDRNHSKDNIERYNILYTYRNEASPKNLIITVPKNYEAYLKCKGVKKEIYAAGENKIETNRYGAQFLLAAHNIYHKALYDAFAAIKSKVEEIMQSEVGFPMNDGEAYSTLYTQLIHANNGTMFSKAFTYDYDTGKGSTIDIVSCTDCITRPAFMISMMRSSKGLKIRVQLSQMLVHEFIEEDFSLATME